MKKTLLSVALVLVAVTLLAAEDSGPKSKTVVGHVIPLGCSTHDPVHQGPACSKDCLDESDSALAFAGVNQEVFLLHGIDPKERAEMGPGHSVVIDGTFAWQGRLRTLSVDSIRLPDEQEHAAAKQIDPEFEMQEYYMTFLRPGPAQKGISDEKKATLMEGHFAHIGRQTKAGKLVIAGPFGDQKPVRKLSGIYIYRAASLDEAQGLTESDPSVDAGYFVAETLPWWGPESLGY